MVKGDFNRPGIACPKCGTVNDLGRPFCKKCGARIYENAAVFSQETKRKNSRILAIQASIASFIFLLSAVLIGLIAWPFEPLGPVGNAADAVHVQRVFVQLERDLTQASPWRGYAVSESGFNAYSERVLDPPMSLRVSAAEDQLVAVALTHVLGFRISTRIVMVPSEEKGYFVPYSLWLGHLPLPVRFSGQMARKRADTLGIQIDELVWERVRIQRVERGNMILTLRDSEGV